jgi:2-desacetyl-2-hydroxyethyl bacteriochlorophyllide A dehydrogenase
MRGVVLVEPGRTEVREVARPDAERNGCALIRMEIVGLCGTDSSIVAGKIPVSTPLVLGHEGVGVVEQAGPLGSVAAGHRVLIDPGIACEICDLCRRGLPNLCRNGGLLGRDFDGVFAEYVAIAERQLLVVPDSVGPDACGLLQVLGTCVHAMSKAPVFPGDTAVVLGLGVAGQLIAQLLSSGGARVVGVTRSGWKRDLAISLGAAAAVAPDDAAVTVADATNGRGPELVVEAVGSETTFAQAIELAGAGGTIVLYGTATGGSAGLPYYQLYFKELTIRNPRAATKADYQRAIDLVADGTIEVAPLVSRRFDLGEAPDALAAVNDASTLKVLMDAAPATHRGI